MKNLTSHPTLLLLAAGFGLFAVLAYVQGRETSPPAQDWQPVADVAPPPSADNVDPTFHARLMRLREQLEATPEDTTVLLDLARLEQDAHQHDRSAGHYERFLALSPRNHQVWLDLANVYAGQELWDEARDASERMLERYPDDPSAMYNLGAIFANQGQVEEAKQWWTTVQESDDPRLAEQATNSLAQLAGVQTASASPRPASSRSSSASRPANPHTASLHQPVVAHRTSSLSSAE